MNLLCPLCGLAGCPRRGCCRPVCEPFTCLRCGMTSHDPADYAAGYCGNCHAWTGPPSHAGGDSAASAVWAAMQHGQDIPPEAAGRELTPEVLLTRPAWRLDRMTAGAAVFAYSPLNGPWVSSWRPDDSLGPFTATWDREDLMKLSVRRDVITRAAIGLLAAAMSRGRQVGGTLKAVAGQLLTWDRRASDPLGDLRAAMALIEEQGRLGYRARAAAVYDAAWPDDGVTLDEPGPYFTVVPGRYRCGCGREFEVPPGHRGLVLCGEHDTPAVMTPAADGPDRGEAIAAIALGGYSIDVEGHLTGEQCEALNEQIRLAAGEQAARAMLYSQPPAAQEDRPPRPAASRARRLRERQALLDRTEELLARLDGEGYAVRAKAREADASSAPEPVPDEPDGHAMTWTPGGPVL